MIENRYPVGIVTKKDISRLDFSVIRPNEFKCVYENIVTGKQIGRAHV